MPADAPPRSQTQRRPETSPPSGRGPDRAPPSPHKAAPLRTKGMFSGSLGAQRWVRSAPGLGLARRDGSGSLGAGPRVRSARKRLRVAGAKSSCPGHGSPRLSPGARRLCPGHPHIAAPRRTNPGRSGSLGAMARVRSAPRVTPGPGPSSARRGPEQGPGHGGDRPGHGGYDGGGPAPVRLSATVETTVNDASTTGRRTIDDATCLGCACLCDDIGLVVEEGRIVEARNACPMGHVWYGVGREIPDESPRIDGRPAVWDRAIERAAEILRGAKAPLVWGLSTATIETQRAAVGIADRIGACVGIAGQSRGGLRPFQRLGQVSATLGEVKDRADLIVYDLLFPIERLPRLRERYADDAVGRFAPEGRAGRTIIRLRPTRGAVLTGGGRRQCRGPSPILDRVLRDTPRRRERGAARPRPGRAARPGSRPRRSLTWPTGSNGRDTGPSSSRTGPAGSPIARRSWPWSVTSMPSPASWRSIRRPTARTAPGPSPSSAGRPAQGGTSISRSAIPGISPRRRPSAGSSEARSMRLCSSSTEDPTSDGSDTLVTRPDAISAGSPAWSSARPATAGRVGRLGACRTRSTP